MELRYSLKKRNNAKKGFVFISEIGKSVLIVLFILFESGISLKDSIAQTSVTQELPVYKNQLISTEKRVEDLLSRMTLNEKIGQLSCMLGWEMYSRTKDEVSLSNSFKKLVEDQQPGMFWATLRADPWTEKTLETGLNPELAAEVTNMLQKYYIENTRLGIPMLFAEECAHGHMAIGTTVFPTAIGQSSTWNPELIKRMANVIAEETRAQGAHIGYGPILDLARDPRWSRLEETYGEDPYLNGQMGISVVRGFQGNDLKSGENIVSTLKHFVAYGISEGGHNGGSVNIGVRELFQDFMPPFYEAVKAGALSIMTAYNSVDGIPCVSNQHLLEDVVRGEWGFEGFFVSDLGGISGLRSGHRVAELPVQAAALALNAGVDVDLGGEDYGEKLKEALQKGLVKIDDIEQSVRWVLKLKFEMGLFENPYVKPVEAKEKVRNRQNIHFARQVARESIILLQNKKLLPLKKDIKSIAVIGPNADNMYNQLGDYTAPQDEDNVVTVLEGIKAKLTGDTKINYVKGCAIRDTSENNIGEAVEVARHSEVAVLVLGGSSARDFKTDYEKTGAASVSGAKTNKLISDMECGEGFDRSTLGLLGKQMELLKRVVETGTPVVVVLIEGRPLNLNGQEANIPAIINAWYPGQQGGNAIADVLFGDYNPAGRLPVTIPKSVGQIPVYYNYTSPRRRDYVETNSKPLFCFGHGLSYTDFEYSNLQVKSIEEKNSIKITVSFNLKNTGKVDGDEVAQLYIRDLIGSVVTPEKQLKRFQRTFLKAGEQKTISFELNGNDLALVDSNLKRIIEPGDFSIMVGASSDDIRLDFRLTVENKFLTGI